MEKKRKKIIRGITTAGVILGIIDALMILILVIVGDKMDVTAFNFKMPSVLLAIVSSLLALSSLVLLERKTSFAAWCLVVAGIGMIISSSWFGAIPCLIFVSVGLYLIIKQGA